MMQTKMNPPTSTLDARHDAIVIGSGPGGASVARALALRGLRCAACACWCSNRAAARRWQAT
jgi:thioredoxin reductase